MLHRNHLITALEGQRELFLDFAREWKDEVREGARRLRELSLHRSGEICEAIGAPRVRVSFPSAELDDEKSFTVGFGKRWRSHEEARAWAIDVLADRVTFAADGSQIMPGREVSLPIAGVQVAWFENPHTRDGRYTKDARFSVITPKELLQSEGGAANAGTVVNSRRTEIEVEVLCDFLERRRGWRERGERMPLAFFDGTFLLSQQRQHGESVFPVAYTRAVAKLIKLSRETETPVVGYIDQSYARDVAHLLESLHNKGSKQSSIYDTQLLRAFVDGNPPLLNGWGERTIFCYCLREGLTDKLLDSESRPLVGFFYLQTTGEGMPVRLDVPAWVYEAGLLAEVADAVRAECVVGNGYPYAIETADAAAVMSASDRDYFLRVIQDFAERENIGFRVSRKAISKQHRR